MCAVVWFWHACKRNSQLNCFLAQNEITFFQLYHHLLIFIFIVNELLCLHLELHSTRLHQLFEQSFFFFFFCNLFFCHLNPSNYSGKDSFFFCFVCSSSSRSTTFNVPNCNCIVGTYAVMHNKTLF